MSSILVIILDFCKKHVAWIIAVVLLVILVILIGKENKYQNKYYDMVANFKASTYSTDSLRHTGRVMQLKIDQLSYMNDSISKKMDSFLKNNNIKIKKVKELVYIQSSGHKNDSIVRVDTIFKDPKINIDTVIGDKWVTSRVMLKYPGSIYLTTSFRSEKMIAVSSKRETVNPAKKFFLFRWFQKRHTVLQVTVTDSNPYIENNQQRFIKIID